jgi:hypothetical protein
VKKRKRGSAFITSGKTAKSMCPGCLAVLDGVTGVNIGADFEKGFQLKGCPTMCGYCGTLLIFADNDGRVRAMTETERNSVNLAPIVEKLYARWRDKVRATGDFTKTRFN